MRITEFLAKESVEPDLKATKKKEVIEELVNKLVLSKKVKEENRKDIIKVLLEREKLGSTGIGQGVAIPHAKSDKIKELI